MIGFCWFQARTELRWHRARRCGSMSAIVIIAITSKTTMSVNKFLLLPLFAALPLAAHAADELAPPDVDPFIELQYGSVDLNDLGLDARAAGYRVRAGLWLNSLATQRLQFALEAGLTQLARETDRSHFSRAPNAEEQALPSPPDSVDVARRDRLEVSGYEFGGRVLMNELIYARAGVFAHKIKSRLEQTRTLNYGSSPSVSVTAMPTTDSHSKLGGYAGVGLLVPVAGKISLALDYSLYLVDGEQLGSYAAGVQLRF